MFIEKSSSTTVAHTKDSPPPSPNFLLLIHTQSHIVMFFGAFQGVTKKCRISRLSKSTLVYEPKCKGAGLQQGFSQRVQANVQINFGDLTPYLTYGSFSCISSSS
jgi:hypothetical protein